MKVPEVVDVDAPFEEWDDGHVPAGAPPGPTRMLRLGGARSLPGFLTVFDDVLPHRLCER